MPNDTPWFRMPTPGVFPQTPVPTSPPPPDSPFRVPTRPEPSPVPEPSSADSEVPRTGRPPGPPRTAEDPDLLVRASISLPQSQKREWEEIARRDKTNVSKLIREGMTYYLQRKKGGARKHRPVHRWDKIHSVKRG